MNVTKLGSTVVSQATKPIAENTRVALGVAKETLELSTKQATPNNIKAFFSKLMEKLKESSTTVKTVSETIGAIKENISKSRKNGKNLAKAIYSGIAESKTTIKDSAKEISGINDVKLAKQEKGTTGAITESGKAAVKVALTGALTVAGSVTPIPGAGLIGLVAGEKIAEKLVGKPISKQVQKLV